MKTKTILLTIAAAVVSAGCAPPPPGLFAKPHTSGDYGLSCQAIQGEIYANDAQIRQWQEKANEGHGVEGWPEGAVRDFRARNTVLQGLLYQKGCANPQAGGAANSGAQQPTAKEKSRVIICNDDQTCVVE